MPRRYWINTISRDHVLRGMAGAPKRARVIQGAPKRAGVITGFTQANHGRKTGVRKLQRGDLMVFYSPRTSYPGGEPLQHFTALGRITDDEPYQVEMTPDFHPPAPQARIPRVRRSPNSPAHPRS
jgi:hypothetical protein